VVLPGWTHHHHHDHHGGWAGEDLAVVPVSSPARDGTQVNVQCWLTMHWCSMQRNRRRHCMWLQCFHHSKFNQDMAKAHMGPWRRNWLIDVVLQCACMSMWMHVQRNHGIGNVHRMYREHRNPKMKWVIWREKSG
jgi:hypothetical protein